MRNYYTELRQAEKLGKSSVRDLIYVFLEEVKEEKDALELDRLMEDISCLFMICENKELKQMYNELAKELCSWYSKNASSFKFNKSSEAIKL